MTVKTRFRPASRAVALEPRILFDGAGAVAGADAFVDDWVDDSFTEVPAVDTSPSNDAPATLVIIDARVADHEALLADLPANIIVRVIGEDESGLTVTGEALANGNNGQGFDAVHIISHGTPGSLTLGSDTVNNATLGIHSEQLQSWALYLNADADILLYGCDIAAGDEGEALVTELAHLTEADIAASINPTGNAEYGGDWVLENETGPIEAKVMVFDVMQGVLDEVSFTDKQNLILEPRKVDEDGEGGFTLENVTVSGSGDLTVTIDLTENGKQPADGTFKLGETNGLVFILGDGSDTTKMTFTGSAEDINAALKTLTYTPTENFNGSANLVISSGGNSMDIKVDVTPVNDAPVFNPPTIQDNPDKVAEVDEEGSGKTVTLTPEHFGIDINNLAGFDPDLDSSLSTVSPQTPDQIVFELKSAPERGRLTIDGAPLLAGSLFSLQDLMDGKIKYEHDSSKEAREDMPNGAGSESDKFQLTVRDGAGAGGDDDTAWVNIKINPINDVPEISGGVAGGTIAYEGRNGVPVEVTVVDKDQLEDSWTFTFDKLVLPGEGTVLYLDRDGDGKFSTNDTQITEGFQFTGSQADLNALLKVDISDDEPAKAIKFDIAVTDDGGGTDNKLTATGTITIELRENNDHPELTTNKAPDLGSAYYPGGDVHVITGNELKDLLGITDKDSPDANLTYTLKSDGFVSESGSSGKVYLLNKDGQYLGAGTSFTQQQVNDGDISIVFTGGGENTAHIEFQVRDGELTAFSTTQQKEWSPAIEGGTRNADDTDYLTHKFYVKFVSENGENPGDGPQEANQAPKVDQINPIKPGDLDEGGSTKLYGGKDVSEEGKPGIVIVDLDNSNKELVIRLEKLPNGGHLTLNGERIPLFGSFTYEQLINGEVEYVHEGGEQFLTSNLGFAFSVSDGSEAVTPPIGGESGSGNNFTVEATPVNDTPEVGITDNIVVLEGGEIIFNTGTDPKISFTDPDGSGDQGPGQDPDKLDNFENNAGVDELYVTASKPQNGDLFLNGTLVDYGTTQIKQSDITSGNLKYKHDGSETKEDSFTLTVNDAQNKDNSQGNTLEVKIQVAPVNDAPSIDPSTPGAPTVDGTLNTGMQLPEGGSGVIAGNNAGAGYGNAGTAFGGHTDSSDKSQLVAIDPDNTDTQIQYKITEKTKHGQLTLNGVILGVGSTFTQADLNAGKVKYTHDASESTGEGKITDSFKFKVGDSGPGEYPEGTFDIEILPANDKPTVDAPSTGPIIIDTQGEGQGVAIKDSDGKSFTVDDVDAITGEGTEDFLQVTVRLLDENGEPITDYSGVIFGYANQSGGKWVVTQNGSESILQFQGTTKQVNDALADLTVKFYNDANAKYKVEVIVDDRSRNGDGELSASGNDANGGEYNEPTSPGGEVGGVYSEDFNWTTEKVPTNIADDGYGNISSKTVDIWVSHLNDLPEVKLPANPIVVNEDVRTPLTGESAISYEDLDAFDSNNNSIILTVENGKLFFGKDGNDVPGGAKVTGGAVGSKTVTLTGTKDQLDAALKALHYQGDENYNGNDRLVVTVDDGKNHGQDGEVGSSEQSTGTVDIHILPVNDGPTVTLPHEGEYRPITGKDNTYDLSGITISDDADFKFEGPNPDSGKDEFKVTLEVSGGSINLSNLDGVSVTGNGTGTVVLTGSRDAINAALAAGVTYNAVTGGNTDATVTFTVTVDDLGNGGEGITDTDSVQPGIGGSLTDSKTLYLQPTSVNDAPTFGDLDDTPTYVQNSDKPVILDKDAKLNDPELDMFGKDGNWGGAELTLERNGGASGHDIFGFTDKVQYDDASGELKIGGKLVGVVTNANGTLTIAFADGTTANEVDQILQAITYSNSDPSPDVTVTINYTVRDGNSNTDPTDSTTPGPNGKGKDQGTGGELVGNGSITVNINRQVIAEPDTNEIDEAVNSGDPTTVTGDLTPGSSNNDNGGTQDRDPDAGQPINVQGVVKGEASSVDNVGTEGVGTEVQGEYGKIVIYEDGTYTYTLNNDDPRVNALKPGGTLTEIFSYAINDGQGVNQTTDWSTLTITINGKNDAPEAVDDSNNLTNQQDRVEGDLITGKSTNGSDTANPDSKSDSDPEGDHLSIINITVTTPEHGNSTPSVGVDGEVTIKGKYGTLTVEPDGSYSYELDRNNPDVYGLGNTGSLEETFEYTLSDGVDGQDTAELVINISGADPKLPSIVPEDHNDNAVGNTDGHNSVDEKGLRSDTDNDNSHSVTGNITVEAGSGIDSITVGGKNILLDDLKKASSDEPIVIDTVHGKLEIIGFSPAGGQDPNAPRAGTVEYRYTLNDKVDHSAPADDKAKIDSIELTVTGKAGETGPGTLDIQIIDDAPEAENDSATVNNFTNKTGGNALIGGSNVGDTADIQGADGATVTEITGKGGSPVAVPPNGSITVDGEHGKLTIHTDGTYTYERNGTGPLDATDEFTYTITDGDTDTDTATITIIIKDLAPDVTDGGDNPPVPTPIDPDNPQGPTRPVIKPDGSVKESGLKGGTTEGDDSNKTTGSITLEPGDGDHTVTITPPDGSPVDLQPGVPTEINTPSGKVTVTYTPGTGTDKPIISYEYELTTRTDGDKTFDEFDVTITDEDGDTTTVTVVVDIVDDVPTAENDTNDITKDGDKPVTVDGDIFENDIIGADGSIASGPVTGVVSGSTGTPSTGVGTPVEGEYGSITINPDGSYAYTLDPNKVVDLTGDETWDEVFTYTITDKDGDTSTAQLTITIHGNTPPVAEDESQTVPEDTPATGNILTNDRDADGDPLEVKDFTIPGLPGIHVPGGDPIEIPGKGTITIGKDGSYTFTPVPDWHGAVPPITYTVTDGKGGEAQATLTITVTPVPDAVPDVTKTESGTPVTIDPLENDKFSNPDQKVTGITQGKSGTVVITPDGRITYTPDPSFFGEDTFTYTVTSGGVTETTTVTVHVADVNPVTPPPPAFDGMPPSPAPRLQPMNPLMGDQAGEPSVFFEGATFDKVLRMPLPFHPVVYVNQEVQAMQGLRAEGDARFFSNPQMARHGQVQSTSIGSGLGADPNLFVQHAVRATQTRADFLAGLVDGRLGRVSLSSDRSLPTPDLFEPNPEQMTNQAQSTAQVQADAPAPEDGVDLDTQDSLDVDISHADTEASPRVIAAQSFTEQLRGGRSRLPAPLLAPHKII